MPHKFLSPIEDVIEDARLGKMYILIDDEDRENEGDLIIPAQLADADAINFMARHGRGLICLPLTTSQADKLNLQLMSSNNQSRHETAFTVSIEAREGVTTGISAADRARTIEVAIAPETTAADIATPGHVFPLVAKDGGVLVRAGHTEAAVDISRLAGHDPSAVICEIMNEDGTMARLPDLVEFAKHHGLKVGTIRDLIAYRLKNDRIINRVSDSFLRRRSGKEWKVSVYTATGYEQEIVALTLGNIDPAENTPVRVHSLNPFEDVLEADHPRTGQLSRAMAAIEQEGKGVVVLFQGMSMGKPSTATASETHTGSLKEYGIGAQILRDQGVKHMILYSNTASNIVGLEGYGLDIVEQRPIIAA